MVWLVVGSACTGDGSTGCTSPDCTETDTPDTDDTPWVNPDWDLARCDRVGATWEEEVGYIIPRSDEQHRVLYTGFDHAGPPYASMSVLWYSSRGASLAPGSRQELEEQSVSGLPVFVLLRDTCGGECDRWFISSSGMVTLHEAKVNGERLRATLDQVILREGTYNTETDESEIAAVGEVWCLESYAIDVPLTTQPWEE